MKIYVGIDIAKLNHFAAAISSDGEIIIEPFKFTNDADGFQLLVSKLESFDKNSLIIGLESTAHYGDNLVRYLVTELYQVCVLNPIKTCQMRKNNVRKTKTDKVDTYVIAKTLMMALGTGIFFPVVSVITYPLIFVMYLIFTRKLKCARTNPIFFNSFSSSSSFL